MRGSGRRFKNAWFAAERTWEILRCAAFRQADPFEGCQLIDPSQHEDATADPGRVHHDPVNLPGQL